VSTPLVVPTGIASLCVAIGLYVYLVLSKIPERRAHFLVSVTAWAATCFAAFCAMFWYVAYGSSITTPELIEMIAALVCGMVFLAGLALMRPARRKS
jgi:hypothetical protein